LSDKGDLEKTIDLNGVIVRRFENLGESKGLGLIYDKGKKRYCSVFCPKEGKFITEFTPKGIGSTTVIGGEFVKIDDGASSDNASITLYNQQNGEVLSKLETIESTKIASLSHKFFYKADSKTLVGFDLKKKEVFFEAKVEADGFEKFELMALNEDVWIFDHQKTFFIAYKIAENKLEKKWSFYADSSMFKHAMLSLDEKEKKLWGIHDDDDGHHIYKWDLDSGELEFKDTLFLPRNAEIIAFHSNGTPILQTNSH
jgi:hypothetical protein